MLRFSTHAIAVALTVLALNAVHQQLHEQPTWIEEACAPAPGMPDPCVFPVEVFGGLAVAQTWYEEGTPQTCPPPAPNQRARSTCVSDDPDFIVWVALTRPDLSKIIFEADSTIYSPPPPASPFWVGVPGDGVWPAFSYGSVFGVGIPVNTPFPQAPTPPFLDAQSANDWWDGKMVDCLAAGAGCGPTPVPLDQTTFNTMLQASPFAAAVYPVTFTQPDGTQVTIISGTQQ